MYRRPDGREVTEETINGSGKCTQYNVARL